ncbi:MAG: methyltransferase domain-containing protein [Gemmatimonadota bacterium]
MRTQRRLHLQWPPTGYVRFGHLRRLTPISPIFGFERGQPIDLYYIARFLQAHADDIRGRALEMGDDTYLRRFGGSRVSRADVMNMVPSPQATIVADLARPDAELPQSAFDCIVFTQTLPMIFDLRTALGHLHRMLKPEGVLLLTSPGIARVGRRLGRDAWGEYWRVTGPGAERLLRETFPGAEIRVTTYGNVLAAISYLHGLAAEELTEAELDRVDPDFEVIVAARVLKR